MDFTIIQLAKLSTLADIMADSFDSFLDEDEDLPADLQTVEGTSADAPSLPTLGTPASGRDFIRSVFRVYNELGGDAWLLDQAKDYPKEFMGLLKAAMPRNVDVKADKEYRIMVIQGQPDPNYVAPTPSRILDVPTDTPRAGSPEEKAVLSNVKYN